MEYKVVMAHSASELTDSVMKLISEGWEVVGSHQAVTKFKQNRFAGMQHRDTVYTFEYTQTMIKKI